jgi:hypothetical protein
MPEVWVNGTSTIAHKTGLLTGFYASAADSWTFAVPKAPLIAVVGDLVARFESHHDGDDNGDGGDLIHDTSECLYCASYILLTWTPAMWKWDYWKRALRIYKQ